MVLVNTSYILEFSVSLKVYYSHILYVIGHKSYLGFFYLYYAYNNAVVHVFIRNLKDSLSDNADAQQMHNSVDEEKDSLEGCSYPSSKMNIKG